MGSGSRLTALMAQRHHAQRYRYCTYNLGLSIYILYIYTKAFVYFLNNRPSGKFSSILPLILHITTVEETCLLIVVGLGIDSRNRVWNLVAKRHRLAGRYENHMPTRFLAPNAGIKFRTLMCFCHGVDLVSFFKGMLLTIG